MLSLLLTAALTISGAHAHARVGSAIAGAGDVNGDGVPDMIVGEPSAGSAGAGAAYVVFGSRDGGGVNLGEIGPRGFRIDGPGLHARAGYAVAGAGDVNGDGLADVIVGAPFSDPNGTESGRAYVVFGKEDTAPVALVDVEAGAT